VRFIYQDIVQDVEGNVLVGGLATVYLANSDTLATIYDAVSGGNALSGSVVTSDAAGKIFFYVDDDDYTPEQRFKVVVSGVSYESQTFDYLKIIPDEGYRYYVDPNATDQGAATTRGNRTIKDHVDAIGTSKKAMLVFIHNGSGNTTTYTLSTAETTPSNITLQIEPGALVKPAAGVSLTVYSPENIIAKSRQQIIDISNNSTNPLLFTLGGCVYPGWTGALGDDSNDDYAAINALVQSDNTIAFPYGTYRIGTKLSIAVDSVWLISQFGKRSIIKNAISGAATDAIEFTTSDPDGVAVFGANCGVKNILITASSENMTGGAALKVTKHTGFKLKEFTALKHPYGIDLYGIRNSEFSDFNLYHTGSTTVNSSALLRISGQLNDDTSYSIPWTTTFGDFHIGCGDTVDYGILIQHSDGLMFSNAYVNGAHEDNLRIAPNQATYTAVNCFFDNIFFDAAASNNREQCHRRSYSKF
jgi:hypothetical protein